MVSLIIVIVRAKYDTDCNVINSIDLNKRRWIFYTCAIYGTVGGKGLTFPGVKFPPIIEGKYTDVPMP